MEDLPREIALDIISRLPITSLVMTKSVCRAWRALAEDPKLPALFSARANERDPSLILHCDCPILNKLRYVGSDGSPDRYGDKVLKLDFVLNSVMPEHIIVGSCNGLLCICDALFFDPIWIYNPFTGDHIELPQFTQYPQQDLSLGFGFHHATMEYKMVRIAHFGIQHGDLRIRGRSAISDVQVITVGTNSWRSIGPFPMRWKLDPRPSEALLNGALHWVTKRFVSRRDPQRRIISFDLAEENFNEIQLPICGSLNRCSFHLVVVHGYLCAAVCLEDKGIELWAMKEYSIVESWSKDYVIGGYVPASLQTNARPNSKLWYPRMNRGAVQVLCMLNDGEILLQYGNGALVLYNPELESFKELVIAGLPKWFDTVVHYDNFFPVESVLRSSMN